MVNMSNRAKMRAWWEEQFYARYDGSAQDTFVISRIGDAYILSLLDVDRYQICKLVNSSGTRPDNTVAITIQGQLEATRWGKIYTMAMKPG
jgi:hypothetical protein